MKLCVIEVLFYFIWVEIILHVSQASNLNASDKSYWCSRHKNPVSLARNQYVSDTKCNCMRQFKSLINMRAWVETNSILCWTTNVHNRCRSTTYILFCSIRDLFPDKSSCRFAFVVQRGCLVLRQLVNLLGNRNLYLKKVCQFYFFCSFLGKFYLIQWHKVKKNCISQKIFFT